MPASFCVTIANCFASGWIFITFSGLLSSPSSFTWTLAIDSYAATLSAFDSPTWISYAEKPNFFFAICVRFRPFPTESFSVFTITLFVPSPSVLPPLSFSKLPSSLSPFFSEMLISPPQVIFLLLSPLTPASDFIWVVITPRVVFCSIPSELSHDNLAIR